MSFKYIVLFVFCFSKKKMAQIVPIIIMFNKLDDLTMKKQTNKLGISYAFFLVHKREIWQFELKKLNDERTRARERERERAS